MFVLCVQFAKAHSTNLLDIEQIKNEITFELSQNIQGSAKKRPILILIGGYPGAGKTTLIQALQQSHEIAVISWNAIRQALLDREVQVNYLREMGHDWEILEAVNYNLFKKCLQHRLHIAIDANAYANNIKFFEDLLKKEGYEEVYQVVKICLNTPTEILLNRVRARAPKNGLHQGTESDLHRDLNSTQKKINLNDYNLILKNDQTIPFHIELEIVESFLNSFIEFKRFS